MSKFDDFTKTVLGGVKGLATGTLKDFLASAKDDAKAFLQQSEDNLRRWTRQLALNELSKDEFEELVRGQAEVAEMAALTQAGITAARIQRFRDALINLVIDAAFKTFIP
jgi:hypothetical protein